MRTYDPMETSSTNPACQWGIEISILPLCTLFPSAGYMGRGAFNHYIAYGEKPI